MKPTPKAISEEAQAMVAERQNQGLNLGQKQGQGNVLQTWIRAWSIGCAGQLRQDSRALRLRLALAIIVVLLLLTACVPAPAGATPPQAPTETIEVVGAYEEAAIAVPRLVLLERSSAAAHDLPTLSALWAEDARIIERRDLADPADDYTWQRRAAILDRYEVAVFPNPPTPLDTPPDAPVLEDGDTATLTNGVDAWTFVWRDGRWWIAELVIG